MPLDPGDPTCANLKLRPLGGAQTVGRCLAVPRHGHGGDAAALHIYDERLQPVCAAPLSTAKANCISQPPPAVPPP